MITVGVFIFDKLGRLLLQRRDTHVSEGGKLGLWGGKVEEKDNEEDKWTGVRPAKLAAVRELREELGLDIARSDLVFVTTRTLSKKDYPALQEDTEEYLYACVVPGPQVLTVQEGQGAEWVEVAPLVLAYNAQEVLPKIVFVP